MKTFRIVLLSLFASQMAEARPNAITESLEVTLARSSDEQQVPVIIRARSRKPSAQLLSFLDQRNFGLTPADWMKFRRDQADRSTTQIRDLLARATGGLSVSKRNPSRYLWAVNSVATKLTGKAIRDIAGHPDVEAVYEDKTLIFIKNEGSTEEPAPKARGSWGIEKIGADKVWTQKKLDGTGVILGSIDTGVDATHPALKDKVVLFKDFVQNMTEAYDDNGHGTHTIGTMVGSDGIGVAPGARIVSAKAMNSFGGGKLSGILDAMQWFLTLPANQKPVAICNSWGVDRSQLGESEKLFWDATKALEDAGILPVFASGNSGPDTEAVPGGYPIAFAVGATDSSDGSAEFSTGGDTSWDGVTYKKPDVSAPGVQIISAWPGGSLKALQGTSMACPHVTGLTALLKQGTPGITHEKIQEAIEKSAVDLGPEGRDTRFGTGRIDAMKAVEAATASSVASAE